jgi:hypothetical protein
MFVESSKAYLLGLISKESISPPNIVLTNLVEILNKAKKFIAECAEL